jgi:Carboxypeptidase regulatory-like domain
MKNLIRGALLSFALVAACMAYGGVSPVNVTVSDAGGKAAFKGATNASGTFATANLKPGNYVVQFNSTEMKSSLYAIVVSAGTKKFAAAAVPGEKFAGGGVALRVVVGAGLNITGQVAPQGDGKAAGDTRKIDDQEVNRLQEHGDNNLAKTMTKWGR